eukprot:m.120262 g.120262  ORF g.120262 m.120262 type:complete len:182 (+) comp15608_c0_seq7:827-1372(+)
MAAVSDGSVALLDWAGSNFHAAQVGYQGGLRHRQGQPILALQEADQPTFTPVAPATPLLQTYHDSEEYAHTINGMDALSSKPLTALQCQRQAKRLKIQEKYDSITQGLIADHLYEANAKLPCIQVHLLQTISCYQPQIHMSCLEACACLHTLSNYPRPKQADDTPSQFHHPSAGCRLSKGE